jgi:membrane-associated phospholipid phosphatase
MPAEVFMKHWKTILVAAVIAAILLSIALVDRPLALWSYDTFHPVRKSFHALTRLVDYIEFLVLAGMMWSGFLFARGRKLTGRDAAILRISLAVLSAIGLKDLLKTIFGRTWPETWVDHNPSFITDHVFTFSPFHGGVGWSSFPSGHETVTAAFCAALWILAPRLRWLCVLTLAVVAVGLLGADEHWLSDVFAGGLVGWLTGVLVAKVELPKAA